MFSYYSSSVVYRLFSCISLVFVGCEVGSPNWGSLLSKRAYDRRTRVCLVLKSPGSYRIYIFGTEKAAVGHVACTLSLLSSTIHPLRPCRALLPRLVVHNQGPQKRMCAPRTSGASPNILLYSHLGRRTRDSPPMLTLTAPSTSQPPMDPPSPLLAPISSFKWRTWARQLIALGVVNL